MVPLINFWFISLLIQNFSFQILQIEQRTKPIRQQLESYKSHLEFARRMPIQSKNMASLLNEISNLNNKLHEVEQASLDAMKIRMKPLFEPKR